MDNSSIPIKKQHILSLPTSLTFGLLLAIALLAVFIPAQPALAATGPLCYVDADATGGGDTGNSWGDAYIDLQDALTDANCTEIWVAEGTYLPASTGADRTATFQLVNGVAVYGGFDGTEIARNERDPGINITILSGDIDNDDSQTPIITDITTVTGNTTNSYHVVTGADNATLDGFTITAGNANSGSAPDTYGGGMYNDHSSPTLTDVTFSGNSASIRGGGMYNYYSNLMLTDVTLSSNSANSASSEGGGMFNNHSSPTLTNVTFSGNSAPQGSGMSNYLFSSPTLMDVTFSGNSADYHGSGMYNGFYSSPTLTNVTFSGNSADLASTGSGGGGMFNTFYCNPTLINVTFSGNSASEGGGMSNHSSSSPTLTNVTFSGNSASLEGGGMSNYGGSSTLTNVTFNGNSASVRGGAMYNSSSSPTLTNVLIANSLSGGDCQGDNVNASSTYNLIEDASNACGLSNGTNGNIIGSDPNLGALANNGGETETHALLAGSPAIDAGTNIGAPSTDQRGENRADWAYDIGAFEMQFSDSDMVSKTIAGAATYTFGPTLAKVVVNDDGGCLTGLSIQRANSDHPQATDPNLQTGVNWTLSPVSCSSGFTVTLTLPAPNFTPDANSKLCRWDSADSSWDCGQSSAHSFGPATMSDGSTLNAVTRSKVNAFSQWTAGNQVGPTAVRLRAFTTSNAGTRFPEGIATLILILLLPLAILSLKNKSQKSEKK